MAKRSNKVVILIGVLGGLVLVVCIAVWMVMSVFADFSEPEVSSKPVQFSLVQVRGAAEQKEARTLEEANAVYAQGERRLEAAEAAPTQEASLGSTSFGFKAREVEKTTPVPASEPQKEGTVATKPRQAPKPKQVAATAGTVSSEVLPEPAAAPARRKRTSFNEDPANEAAKMMQQAANQGIIQFRGRIFEDVEITSTSNVRVRVLEEFTYNGCTIKRNTLLPATASRGATSITVSIQNMMACGNRVTVSFHGHSLDGSIGLPVREDGAAEAGVREGGSAAVTGAANATAARAGGILGIVGSAVASGISGGTRTAQNRKPALLEEGRELLFIGS
ncbi:MAG: conjugative transposon protein TraM [Prevotellaceae bacterium]|jgi:hypothetical protein|nr:conjugative transposon protein TraM [Prevotellaceae bacterium]